MPGSLFIRRPVASTRPSPTCWTAKFAERCLRRHEEQRDLALAQADAREAQLKDFARDEIVRALGPGAAPLVRAPHEPQLSKEDPEA